MPKKENDSNDKKPNRNGVAKSTHKPWRSKRKRQSPEEAARERARALQAERAETQRRVAQARQLVAQQQAALLNQPPAESRDRSALDNVAFNVHSAYNWDGHADECVTAVVRKHNGRYVVFCQRFMRAMETYAGQHYGNLGMRFKPGCPHGHMHAEMYAVFHYLQRGRDPSEEIAEIGVSKPICPQCKIVLDHLGIRYNPRWVTGKASKHWKDPWDYLPDDCEPAVKSWRQDEDDEDENDEGGGSRRYGGHGSGLSGEILVQ